MAISFHTSPLQAFRTSPLRARKTIPVPPYTIDTPRSIEAYKSRLGFLGGNATPSTWNINVIGHASNPYTARDGTKVCYLTRTMKFRATPDVGSVLPFSYIDSFGNPVDWEKWVFNSDTSEHTGVDHGNRYTSSLTQSDNSNWFVGLYPLPTLGTGYQPYAYPYASTSFPASLLTWDTDTVSGAVRTRTKSAYNRTFYHDETNDIYFHNIPPNYPPGVTPVTIQFDLVWETTWSNEYPYEDFIEDVRTLFYEAADRAEALEDQAPEDWIWRITHLRYDTTGAFVETYTGGGTWSGFGLGSAFHPTQQPRFPNPSLGGGQYRWQDRGSFSQVPGDSFITGSILTISSTDFIDTWEFQYAAVQYQYTGPMAMYRSTGPGGNTMYSRTSELLLPSGSAMIPYRFHFEIPDYAAIDECLDSFTRQTRSIDLASEYSSVTPNFPVPS
jgi:hypothetical protein